MDPEEYPTSMDESDTTSMDESDTTEDYEEETDEEDDDDGAEYVFDWEIAEGDEIIEEEGDDSEDGEDDGFQQHGALFPYFRVSPAGSDDGEEEPEPEHPCCGLCGVPIHNPYPDKSEYTPGLDSHGDPYDWPPRDIEEEDRLAEAEEKETGERRLQKPEGDWLKNVRLMGYLTDELAELDIPTLQKGDKFSFISVIGNGYAGAVDFIAGPYLDLGTEVDCIPIHDCCYKLLDRAVNAVRAYRGYPGKVQTDVLVGALLQQSAKALKGLPSIHDLSGVQHFLSDDYRWVGNQTSDAWYITDFMTREGVYDYCKQPPPPPANQLVPAIITTPLRLDNPESALNKLPSEVLMQILCLLSRKDAQNFRTASRTVASVPLPQEFWKWRLLEIPYLWEVNQHFRVEEWHFDWRRLYEDLIAKDPKTPELRGFRNRKRVWKIALQAAEDIWEHELQERKKKGCFTARIAQKLGQHWLWAADRTGDTEYYNDMYEAASYRGFYFLPGGRSHDM